MTLVGKGIKHEKRIKDVTHYESQWNMASEFERKKIACSAYVHTYL
jgi:hypothetical protein